jgi:integrase
MSLYKRKDSPYWWIKLSHNGRAIQKSAGTADRLKAREYHDKLRAQLWDVTRLGVKPSRTWEEAVLRWLEEKGHKASLRDDLRNFRWLHSHLAGMELSQVDRDVVEEIAQARRREGVRNGTVNRTLALLRSVLRAASEDWEWLERAPRVRLLPEPKGRVRFLTTEECSRLLAELPEHLRAMVRFSVLTGLRQRNVRELRWAQVDLERRFVWVHANQAKGGEGIAVPLTAEAVRIVSEQSGRNAEFVFTYRGKPIPQANGTAWRAALQRAKVEDFRWHDLRHTWATLHAQAGTPLHVLQELGGWRTASMVRRYAHLTGAHLSTHVDAFGTRVNLTEQRGYDLATRKEGEEAAAFVTT